MFISFDQVLKVESIPSEPSFEGLLALLFAHAPKYIRKQDRTIEIIQKYTQYRNSFFPTVAQGGPISLSLLGVSPLRDLTQISKQLLRLRKTQHIITVMFYLKERAILFHRTCTFLFLNVVHSLLCNGEESRTSKFFFEDLGF